MQLKITVSLGVILFFFMQQPLYGYMQSYTAYNSDTTKRKDIANKSVSQQEIDWGISLENKVKGGYQPTQEEVAKYENIAQRLAASQTQQQHKTNTSVETVSDEELKWALSLEEKLKSKNYQPTQEETAKYQNIAQRLAASK